MPKTFDVPDTLPYSKVRAFFADIGLGDVEAEEVRSFHVDGEGVFVELMARDAHGSYYIEPISNEVATHRIAIRLDCTA